MPNITARYWGIRSIRNGAISIGEVDVYAATTQDLTEMTQIAGMSYYSDWLDQTALAPAIIASSDGDLISQQTITNSPIKQFGIAIDCDDGTDVRAICIRNASDRDAVSFVPFAVDSLDFFVGKGLEPGASKIQQYSILKNVEIDGSINYIYTILPAISKKNASIARKSITDGEC